MLESDLVVMNEQLHRKLRHLGRAVFDAISESRDVSEALDGIRAEGYSLSMQLNCKKGDSAQPVEARVIDRVPKRLEDSSQRAVERMDPLFRLHGDDLSFLRSIGIDPTRRIRRRR